MSKIMEIILIICIISVVASLVGIGMKSIDKAVEQTSSSPLESRFVRCLTTGLTHDECVCIVYAPSSERVHCLVMSK